MQSWTLPYVLHAIWKYDFMLFVLSERYTKRLPSTRRHLWLKCTTTCRWKCSTVTEFDMTFKNITLLCKWVWFSSRKKDYKYSINRPTKWHRNWHFSSSSPCSFCHTCTMLMNHFFKRRPHFSKIPSSPKHLSNVDIYENSQAILSFLPSERVRHLRSPYFLQPYIFGLNSSLSKL